MNTYWLEWREDGINIITIGDLLRSPRCPRVVGKVDVKRLFAMLSSISRVVLVNMKVGMVPTNLLSLKCSFSAKPTGIRGSHTKPTIKLIIAGVLT